MYTATIIILSSGSNGFHIVWIVYNLCCLHCSSDGGSTVKADNNVQGESGGDQLESLQFQLTDIFSP